MKALDAKLIETAICIGVFLLIKLISSFSIAKTVSKHLLKKSRGQLVKKIVNIILMIVLVNFSLIIWGVDQSEVLIFMTSVLTVIGVGLFAQWSLLSNMTAGLILFFNHSVKLGDTITIMDKDYEMEGKIVDIGFFFITMITNTGDQLTLPCNIFLQKTIKKKKGTEKSNKHKDGEHLLTSD